MVNGTTRRGFAFSVDPKKIENNMELLDMLADADSGNAFAMPRILRQILPEEQRTALYESLRGEDGIVPADLVGEALMDIVASFSSGKK